MMTFKFNLNHFDERESSALLIDYMVNKGYLTSSTIYQLYTIQRKIEYSVKIFNTLNELKFEINNSPNRVKII